MSLYRIKIFKYAVGDPTRKWSNTYEAAHISTFGEDGTWEPGAVAQLAVLLPEHIQELEQVTETLVLAEKAIHTDRVRFDYATISTYAEGDTESYDAIEFANIPLSGVGGRTAVNDQGLEDREVCYHVRKKVRLGRPGKNLYQGCLLETDVEGSSSIRKRLTAGTSLAAAGQDWLLYEGHMMNIQEDANANNNIRLVMAGKNRDGKITVRRVLGFEVGGVSVTNLVRR